MEENEYQKRLNAICDTVPEAFRGYIRSQAWDTGHAYGYEEVLIHAETIAEGLSEPIKQFRRDCMEFATKKQATREFLDGVVLQNFDKNKRG